MFSDWLNKTPGSKKAGAIPFLKKGKTSNPNYGNDMKLCIVHLNLKI